MLLPLESHRHSVSPCGFEHEGWISERAFKLLSYACESFFLRSYCLTDLTFSWHASKPLKRVRIKCHCKAALWLTVTSRADLNQWLTRLFKVRFSWIHPKWLRLWVISPSLRSDVVLYFNATCVSDIWHILGILEHSKPVSVQNPQNRSKHETFHLLQMCFRYAPLLFVKELKLFLVCGLMLHCGKFILLVVTVCVNCINIVIF